MKYDSYRYLWPPRPEQKIAPSFIDEFERQGWWAQAKANGTNCVIYVYNGESFAMGRHGPDNKLEWQPGVRWNIFARTLAPNCWHVFQGELLHSKVKGGPRDTVYLFDMLVDKGTYLVGHTYSQRYRILRDLLYAFEAQPIISHDHLEFSPGIWLTSNHAHSFTRWFKAPAPSHVEGLVFKDPTAKLLPCGRATSNNHGQAKVRYAKANLSF